MPPRFLTDFDPDYGRPVDVVPGVVRVVAENPGKYTAWGTGTYVVGEREVAVVDPGPDLTGHVEALLAALDGRRVACVLVTHTHADHSPAARAISRATGAPTYGFGPHPPDATSGDADTHAPVDAEGSTVEAGRSDVADRADTDESGDREFVPDVEVRDGDVVEGDGFRFECLHTPGHISNHICYAESERNLLFPGDHVMGWSTTVVSPPDGDMRAYVANLRRLVERRAGGLDATYLPTHGPPIADPGPFVEALVEHRLDRDRQILELLDDGPRTVDELVAVMYADVRPELHAPAGRSVLAHLLALRSDGVVEEGGHAEEGERPRWRLAGPGGSLGA